MKTLLFNKNPIISKLVRMSAQKMEYEFEERLNYASDIDSYDVIIVDDGISADLKVLQGKCKKLIYISSGASANEESRQVLHKPFLPTDLIALMRIDEVAAAQSDKDKGTNAEKTAPTSENVSANADENASADEEDINLDSLSFDNKLLEPESASEPALAEAQNESANAANDEAVPESASDDNAQDNNIYLQDITGENAENAGDEKESAATTAQNSASDEPSTDENAQNTEPEKPKDELEITPVDFKAGDFDFDSIAPSGETALNSDIADEILANIQSQEPANTSEPASENLSANEPASESALNASQNDESSASEDAPLEFDAQDLADITQGLGVDEQGAENSALNEDSQSESALNPQNDENNATDFPQQGTLSDDELAKASFLQPLNEPFQSEQASTSDEPADENLAPNSNETADESLTLNSNEQTSENLTLNSSETKGENLADEDLSQILNDEQATDIQAKSTSSEQDLSDESLPQENAENAPEMAQETPNDELATQENAEFSSENSPDIMQNAEFASENLSDENAEILGENLDENAQTQSPALDETSAEIQAQIKDISALENEANAPLDEPQSAKSVMNLDEGAQGAENALEMAQETLESTQNAENSQTEQDTAQETPNDELTTQENAEFASENLLETTQKAEFASENSPDIMQNTELTDENSPEIAQNAEFASQTAEQENEPLPQEPAFSVEEKQEKTMSFEDLPENAKFLGQKNNDFVDPDDIKPVLLDEMPMQQSTQDIVKGQLADLNAMDEELNSPNAQNSPSSEDDTLTNSLSADNENLLDNLNTEQNATLAPSEQNESILASENLAQTQVSLDESLAQNSSEIKFDESFAPSDDFAGQENAEFASENSLQTAQSDENLAQNMVAQMQSDENFAQANDENLAQTPQINAPSSENALNADLTDDLQGLSEEELQRALGEIPAQTSQAQINANKASQNTSAQNGENSSPSELMDELSRGISGAITSSIKDDALKAALKGMNMHIDINIKFDEDKA